MKITPTLLPDVMKLYLIFIILSIISFLLPHNIIASNNEYYIKILEYGTDSDIVKAFSVVQEDLGAEVNKKAVKIFEEMHADRVYLSLVRYLGLVKFNGAEEILKIELERDEKGDDYREEIIYVLGEIRAKSSMEQLRKLYQNEGASKRLKMAIMDAWGKIGDMGIEDEILAILKDDYEDKDVKARAVIALGELKSTKSLPLLKEILLNKYENKILRMYSAYALSRIGGEEVLDTLEQVIYDDSHEVAEYAVKGISEMESNRCGQVLVKALRSDYDKVRYYAVLGLRKIKYRDAIDILRFKAEYDTNERVRMEAENAVKLLLAEEKDLRGVSHTDE